MTATVTPLPWVPELTYGDRLRIVRRGYGARLGKRMTGRAFATLIGVPHGTYGPWETGASQPDDVVEMSNLIASITGCDSAWLAGIQQPSGDPEGTRDGGSSQSACNVYDLFGGDRVVTPHREDQVA